VVALVLSLALHASALLSPAHGAPPQHVQPDGLEIAIEASEPERAQAPAPEGPALKSAPVALTQSTTKAVHHHSYSVAPGHDLAPHDPAMLHAPWPATAPEADSARAPIVTETREPVRFVMRARALTDSAGRSTSHAGVERAASATGRDVETAPIFAESAVDAPARLLASVPLSYPESARSAEREADVALELVVSSAGHVVSARTLSTPGFGFEAEALRAARRYRFSSALRAGHPVSVRMRWVVSFRLR
jgi:TonB family protein